MRPIDAVQVLKDINWHHKPTPASEFESGFNRGLNQAMWIITHASTLAPPPITGDTSDGYHTFNELYHHRAVLFSVICNEHPDIAWKSKKHHDGTMYDGMFIVGINTPEGQATYHYDIVPYWDSFRVKEIEFAPEWDGHTPDEAIRRIGTLTPPNEWVSVKTPPTEQGWYHVAILDLKTGKYKVEQDLYSIEMAKIYRDILTGTMDAYASIISNNLNGVMKYLTSITIILAIPTMIASYWGMNVPVPLQENPFGFVLIVVFSILIGVIASLWLKKKGMLD